MRKNTRKKEKNMVLYTTEMTKDLERINREKTAQKWQDIFACSTIIVLALLFGFLAG